MNVSVVVPFRPDSPERIRAWAWARLRWKELLGPGGEIIECDSGSDVFNRGASINQGVAQVEHPTLVIADADTVASDWETGVEAASDGHWTIAHAEARYHQLTYEGTLFLLACHPCWPLPSPAEIQFGWKPGITSMSGVLVMPTAAFRHVGGFDERFGIGGWGGEDLAFQITMDKLWEPHRRTAGFCLHLDHPRGLEYKSPGWPHNALLLERYREWFIGTPGFERP